MIRRLLSAAVVVAAALSLTPGGAADASGTIVVPTAGTARINRCLEGTGVPNGTFGWTTAVNDGKQFTLSAVGGDDVADLDIAFYTSLTSCEADAAVPANDHVNVEGDESGTVPLGATVAVITVYVGPPALDFVYDES